MTSSARAEALTTTADASREKPRSASYAHSMAVRTWQVTADVVFPNQFPMDVVDGETRLPQQLRPQSRIPRQARELGDATAFVRPSESARAPGIESDLRWSVADLIIRLASEADDPSAAVDDAAPYLERVLESLCFQMQNALHMQGVEAIDLTAPVAVGDRREMFRWSAFATPAFRPTSVPMQSLIGRLVPYLSLDLDPADQRANRALDWYLKALAAPFETDHFIFLWIAVEILAADSGLQVSEPYRGPDCGHEISACPSCGAATTRLVQGASIRRFLVEGFGVDEGVAKRIWTARQILHGAHAFDSRVMTSLPELSQRLRAVLVAALTN